MPSQGRLLAVAAVSDRAGEGVALASAASPVAGREPLLPLGGGAVRPAVAVDAPAELALDPVVADRGRRVEAVRDVGGGDALDEAGLDRVVGPDPGVAVRLQLQ